MLRILYVDPKIEDKEEFIKTLEQSKFIVDWTNDPVSGLEHLSKHVYNIVISELEFETFGGLRFMESVANIYPHAKRVIYTNNEDPSFEVVALKENIDLYLLKSRGRELALNSIKLLSDKISKEEDNVNFIISKGCGLKMNLLNHDVTIDDKEVSLTPKEFEILKLLVVNKGEVLSRKEIISEVWKEDEHKSVRIVDTHIKKIREKTKCYDISTVRGYGYMWRA